jgi:hypothetical protein
MNLRKHASVALAIVLLGLLVLPNTSSSVLAGEGQGPYLAQASTRLIQLVGRSNADGFKLQNNSFSIGGGWLIKNNTWVPLFTLSMEEGRDYRCLAAGDNDARDVDLQVVDPNGQVVAEDTGGDPEAVVNYRPKTSGKHLVRLRLYASEKNQPCVCLGLVMAK